MNHKIQRKETEEITRIDGVETRTKIVYEAPETSQLAHNVAALALSAAMISGSITVPILAGKVVDAVFNSNNTCQK